MANIQEIADEIEKDLDSIMIGRFNKRNTTPTVKMKEEINFKCRICGCTKYEGVYEDSRMVPLGGTMYPIAYQCSGCSVVFKSLVLFSADKTKRQIPDPISTTSNLTDDDQKWFNDIAKRLNKNIKYAKNKPS